MTPVSVCIITKNEEKNLEKCLQQLQTTPYEIVVVDTGSTDHTRQIAEKYATKVTDFEWVNDFSAARNFSLAQASHDWVLVIDSDEFLEEIDLAAVDSFIRKSPRKIGRILIRNFTQEEGASLDRVERFFSRKCYCYEGIVHEQVVPRQGIAYAIEPVPITVGHVGYAGTPEENEAKARRDRELLLKDLERNPDNPYTLFQMGQSYLFVWDYENAYKYFDRALAFDIDPQQEYVQFMIVSYGYCLLHTGREEQALSFQNIYQDFNQQADFVFLMGMIYSVNKQPLKALGEFLRATTISEYRAEGVNSYKAFYNAGTIYEEMGDKKMAAMLYESAGDYAPALERKKNLYI